MVKLVATVTSRRNQPRIFENIEVLRDCLATRGHLMLGRQARADFKKRLSILCGQFIEDRSPGRVCQGLEDIAQPGPIIGKSILACQEIAARRRGLPSRSVEKPIHAFAVSHVVVRVVIEAPSVDETGRES